MQVFFRWRLTFITPAIKYGKFRHPANSRKGVTAAPYHEVLDLIDGAIIKDTEHHYQKRLFEAPGKGFRRPQSNAGLGRRAAKP